MTTYKEGEIDERREQFIKDYLAKAKTPPTDAAESDDMLNLDTFNLYEYVYRLEQKIYELEKHLAIKNLVVKF